MANNFRLDYTVLDGGYQNGSLQVIIGDDAGTNGNFGSIQNPANTGVPIEITMFDPVVFSYVYGGSARVLMGKITTSAGTLPSATSYTLLALPGTVGVPWPTALATNISLVDENNNPVATNPHGVAQVGDWLYIVNYDSQKITRLGTNELNGLSAGSTHPVAKQPFDLAEEAELPDNCRGQAVIALKDGAGNNYLFALYIRNNPAATQYNPSILVKMAVNADGSLRYVAQAEVGMNATEIIPVDGGDGGVTLLVPAMGGPQQGGTTNGANSNITAVPAFASTFTARVLLKGDDPAPTPPTFDLREIAAPMPGSGIDGVFIMTGTYDTSYNQNWTLYWTSITKLLGFNNTPISTAAGGTDPALITVDGSLGSPGYYWSILWENGDANNKPRLWFLRGSPILATLATDYNSPTSSQPDTNKYKFFAQGTGPGQIGGQNVNSADLIAETLRQAAAGVSLKRSLRGRIDPHVRAAIQKAAAATAEEERK
jgi:hypothetical protein